MRDLFPPHGLPVDPERLLPLLRRAIDGKYGGLIARVTEVSGSSDALNVAIQIFDINGIKVGDATRTYYHNNGQLIANHANLFLQRHVRGQGFATEFNNEMFGWYRESHVDHVLLRANIDVGSYAWALQGFDFRFRAEAVSNIKPRLAREVNAMLREAHQLYAELKSIPDGPERSEGVKRYEQLLATINEGRGILARFHEGSTDFPTAREIAQLGRPADALPGQSKDLSWPGKRVFMESKVPIWWQAIKRLDEE
ncbi:hypothetical protein [Nocardia wallacei]|uniref:hypothetical protein n=1 Tax=Nocardia wallacei TaxID=480035 RepID=UPI002457B0BE|nr:hypothetical protein [Nocardia wallacei]